MNRILGIAAALACFAGPAMAGPNAGGVLIVVTGGTIFCGDEAPYCGSTPIADCATGVVRADGVQTEALVLNVLAAFSSAASNRLLGVTFGIAYDDTEVFLAGTGSCGDFEIADTNWPSSGSGTAITWNAVQTDPFVDVYWVAAYNYYGNPKTLDLGPHPIHGGNFADDSIPSEIDPIVEFGAFGFDVAGTLVCPEAGNVPGACCDEAGTCELLLEVECLGTFLGVGSLCDPNPCPQPPLGACCIDGICSILTETECTDAVGIYLGDDTVCESDFCVDPVLDSSWGVIKSTFR